MMNYSFPGLEELLALNPNVPPGYGPEVLGPGSPQPRANLPQVGPADLFNYRPPVGPADDPNLVQGAGGYQGQAQALAGPVGPSGRRQLPWAQAVPGLLGIGNNSQIQDPQLALIMQLLSQGGLL